jgi:2-iminobutanoate/2-iminopropanoate deaminase
VVNKMMKRIINTPNAPAPIGPYSQAVAVQGFLYVSGQIALDPATNELTIESIESESRRVMENVQAVLNAAGYSFNDVIKSTIFLSDMALFPMVNDVYGSYFEADFPARETVAVAGLPKGVNVEISVIAYKGT